MLTLRSHRVRFGDAASAAVRVHRRIAPNLGPLRGTRVRKRALAQPIRLRWRAPTAFADFLSLTKPRLNFLVVVTAAVGLLPRRGTQLDFARLARRSSGSRLSRGRRGPQPDLRARNRQPDVAHATRRLRPKRSGSSRCSERASTATMELRDFAGLSKSRPGSRGR